MNTAPLPQSSSSPPCRAALFARASRAASPHGGWRRTMLTSIGALLGRIAGFCALSPEFHAAQNEDAYGATAGLPCWGIILARRTTAAKGGKAISERAAGHPRWAPTPPPKRGGIA